jgi:ribonuclease J
MWVRIHRGASEIGGSCVEVREGEATILLDLGRPLWAAPGEHVPLPPAIGLGEPGPLPLAVLLTHGHQDHWGLVPDLPRSVPVWIGKGAADVLRAAAFWGTGIDLVESGSLQDRVSITIGPFTVTPYLADHSAFDAYSLLVESGGARLFYTGDLRGHGRKQRAFERLLAEPPSDVDALLLEGTNLRESDTGSPPEPSASESDVEAALTETLLATEGLVVVLGSALNIDRLVTVYRAAKRAGRKLAVDLYTAEVAAATGRGTIPRIGVDWPLIAAYLPVRQRVRVKESGEFHRTAPVRARRIFDEDLAAGPSSWVLFGAYQSQVPLLLRNRLLDKGAVVWSMWDGYLDQPGGRRLLAALSDKGVPLIHHHTSGHAGVADLARLAAAIDPGTVVPIHTEAPGRYADVLGRPVVRHDDGQWWQVRAPAAPNGQQQEGAGHEQ